MATDQISSARLRLAPLKVADAPASVSPAAKAPLRTVLTKALETQQQAANLQDSIPAHWKLLLDIFKLALEQAAAQKFLSPHCAPGCASLPHGR